MTAADMPRGPARVAAFEDCAEDLQDANRVILDAVIKHLYKISTNAEVNMMKPSNLGVCFGPTLLWSKEGDLASISGCNKVVETLIEDYAEIGTSLLPEGSVPDDASPLRNGTSFRSLSDSASVLGVPMDDLEEECDDYDIGGDAELPLPPPVGTAQRLPPVAPKPVAGPPPTPPSAGSKPTLQLEPPALDVVTEDVVSGVVYGNAAAVVPGPSYNNLIGGSGGGAATSSVVDAAEYSGGGSSGGDGGGSGEHFKSTDSPLARESSLMGFVSADEEDDADDDDDYDDYGVLPSGPSSQAPAAAAGAGGSADDTAGAASASGNPIPGARYRATFTCVGGDEDELSFEKGTIINNVQAVEDEDGWWEGTHELNGMQGLFPSNYVQLFQ